MTTHKSVLLGEALDALDIREGDTVVDATVGGAGHFTALLERLGSEGTLIGIDADKEAITRGAEAAVGARANVRLVENNFRNLSSILKDGGITSIDRALFDLGWSSYHLSSGRGFSFRTDEPLLMTYGNPETAETTAADVVNQATEEELSDLIFTLGEERFARQIARGITEARKQERILTTGALASVIEESVPSWYRNRRIHPATKTFQALRIHVNDELGALREGLSSALTHLSDEGRVALITFHSIEDRIVKTMLRDAAHEGLGCLITKKPIAPSSAELKENPRARSAKLRVFEKGACLKVKATSFPTYSYA
jgi:16S rRNA (cytosine1402-N4)-methyltransferase